MRPHWTANKKMIRKAIRQDTHPISLLALELKSLSDVHDVEAMRLARLLVDMAWQTRDSDIEYLKIKSEHYDKYTNKIWPRSIGGGTAWTGFFIYSTLVELFARRRYS